MIEYFHADTNGTVQFNGSWSEPLENSSGVKQGCVLASTLFGIFFALLLNMPWTQQHKESTLPDRESRLNKFHLRSIRRILGISWQDKVTNADVLYRAALPSTDTLLYRQRRLRWLGHVRRMEDGRIPKDILYGQLVLGRRATGRPHLRYKDVCVRYMKAVDIDTMSSEGIAADRRKRRRCILSATTTVTPTLVC